MVTGRKEEEEEAEGEGEEEEEEPSSFYEMQERFMRAG
jgi:hypothetical protein